MRDPFLWSIPLGRLFGITIRVHVFYPVLVLALMLRVAFQKDTTAAPGAWIDVGTVSLILLVSVLLHEFGHCFAARRLGGDAHEVLIWPLGGLANVDVPHTAKANFLTAAAGPAVDLVLCVIPALLLAFTVEPSYQPPWSPTWYPLRLQSEGGVLMTTWSGHKDLVTGVWPVFLARLFWLNWVLLWLNIILVGFPMDAGRMLQAALWPHLGYRQAMLVAVFAGFITMFVVAVFAICTNELLPLCLALFIYVACRNQWIILETGGEEGLFGYDFSQGYTSLERDQPPARTVRRVSWWQRWLQKRAARKMQREQETREADERRLDELLEKVQRQGKTSLTDEELRFMKRVSDRYRNRN